MSKEYRAKFTRGKEDRNGIRSFQIPIPRNTRCENSKSEAKKQSPKVNADR